VATTQLLHHGLITVRSGARDPGIYWLRLWQTATGHVAVVTEVPGNPGFSVTNGMPLIRSHLVDEFGVDCRVVTLYEIWPPGSLEALEHGGLFRVELESMEPYSEVSIAEIEAAAGEPLPHLPAHEELYALVREAGGGIFNPVYERIFEAVPMEDIPVPHNPSRCEHAERFSQIERALANASPDGGADPLEVGHRFLDGLTQADRDACQFHRGNWRAVADESVRIIQRLGQVDSEVYVDEADRSNLDDKARWLLHLMFAMPINVAGGEFTDGQHRSCALRFSGATHAALVVGVRSLGSEEEVWTYLGGG
jgi:hypothetical protein